MSRAMEQIRSAEAYCDRHGLTNLPRLGRMVGILSGHLHERDIEQGFPDKRAGLIRAVIDRNGVPVAVDYETDEGEFQGVWHVYLRGGVDLLMMFEGGPIEWADAAAMADLAGVMDGATAKTPRFSDVSCSHCAQSFGPGDAGYSNCDSHAWLVGRAA